MKCNFFIFTFIIYCFLFSVSIINALPDNAINKSFNEEFILKIYPQGWGFFSKDPTEDNLHIRNERGEEITNFPLNTFKNSLGISREGRTHGIEYGIFAVQLDDEDWIECTEGIDSCLEQDKSSEVEVINDNVNPIFCGTNYLVQEEMIPWSWAKYKDNMDAPSSYVKVGIECTNS